MLEDKLRLASQNKVKKHQRLMLILSMAALAGSAFFVFTPAQNSTTPPLINTTTPAAVSAMVDIPPELRLKQREQFMLKLQLYRADIEPAMFNLNIASWRPEAALEIDKLKQQAINAFATAHYSIALEQLQQASDKAIQLLALAEKSFTTAFSQAETAFHLGQFDTATIHINKALHIKANDSASQHLAQQIHLLPTIITLLKEADIAHIENKLQHEYNAITKALALAPQRIDLQQRKNQLEEQIKQRQFTTHIRRGLGNVKNNQLELARQHYKQARALSPQRAELYILNKAIQKLAITMDLNNAINQAEIAIQQDHWQQAQSIYATAAPKHPNNKSIHDGLQLSNKIVSLLDAANDYIQRPQRLSSSNIAANAQALLLQIKIFAGNSKSLQGQLISLKKLLTERNTPIPVRLTSDNQTYILVKGVGKVGVIQQHVIQLKPGTYSFEGSRRGYKSKLLEVHIPIGASNIQVEVICDEPI